jgi:phage terminase large subunit-like protein
LPNGSVIMAAGLDDADRVDKILGMEFSTVYFNECTQIPWASVETALSRLAEKSELKLRAYFDCNPTTKLHWTYHLFVKKLKPGTREPWAEPSELAEMQINPDDNREHISDDYFKVLEGMSAAKRKRFRDGEWAEDTEGALWTLEGLDRHRIAMGRVPDLVRIVVAVDPSGTAGKGEGAGDDVGIVVAGLGVDGRWYVLADHSCNLSPAGWGRRAVDAYREWGADRIVAETNFGGAMVKHVIKSVDASVPFKEVKASRGKIARAEPISALYEEGKVSHVGTLPDLEDQMCAMTPSGFIGEGSPDRADALVWAITELSGKTRREPGVRRL